MFPLCWKKKEHVETCLKWRVLMQRNWKKREMAFFQTNIWWPEVEATGPYQLLHLKPPLNCPFLPFWADTFHPLCAFCGFQLPAERLRVVSVRRTIWLIGASILSAKSSSAFFVGTQLAIVLNGRQRFWEKVESWGGSAGPQSANCVHINVLGEHIVSLKLFHIWSDYDK